MPEYKSKKAIWVARLDYSKTGPFNWQPALVIDGNVHVLDIWFATSEAVDNFIQTTILTAMWSG